LPAWFAEATRSQAAEPPSKSPNERPGIGLVGCGGMGKGDCNAARHYGEVVAVCDVDDKQAAQAVKDFTKDGKAPAKYNDFRKMLERPDVEVVITGTPDHWHTLVNLAAVHAGKDVYTEKPLTLTIDEGKRLVRAVKATRRVLQVGSQQRSERGFRLACELVRNGRIGKLQHMIVGLPTGPREGPFPAQPVPEGMDWDFYVGQAPFFEFNGRNHHWNFRWWWRFSGGQMTDWGAHHNDIAQWGNGTERSGPVEVDGKSLIDMIPGGYDAAAKYRVDFKYANGVTLTIVDDSTGTDRNVVGDKKRTPNGIQFLGTAGWIFVTRGRIQASVPELLEDPLAPMGDRLYRSDNHMGNFFESVKSRKPPICDAEIGHRSITVAHLGVISVRLGRPLKWNPDREEFVDDKEANQWLAREMRRPYDYSFIGLQG
jgi:predicted dehydrogenase